MTPRGIWWLGFYVLLVLSPLMVAAAWPGAAAGRAFGLQFSVACGFVGLAILSFEFVLISKVQSAASAFGQDALLRFHHQMGMIAAALLLVHPAVLITGGYPAEWLNPLSPEAPLGIRLGVWATAALLLLIVLSLGRQRWKLSYEWWQLTHGLLTVAILVLSVAHLWLAGTFVAGRPVQILGAVYGSFLLGMAVRFKLLKPLDQWRKPWSVVANLAEAGDCRTLVLQPLGHSGLTFEPGQFAYLNTGRTPFHLDQHPISFSSCAYDEPGQPVAFTIRDLGDWSGKVVPRLEPGARVWVDGPYGVFTADQKQGPGYVLIGGGVGVTPLVSICETFAHRGDRRPVLLVFAAREPVDLIFVRRLEELRPKMTLETVFVVEEAPAEWPGERGRVTPELLRRHLPPQYKRFQFFVCGPPPMMDAMERTLPSLGVPAANIHTERFDMV